jgi:catecholate siderophore receptor
MSFRFTSAALAIALITPGIALADDGGEAGEAGDAIIVTGKVEGYRTVDTTSGTKTNTPILDVPQSISVVTSEQISDQSIRSIADLVHLFPGISAGQGEGHRDQITLRGNNSTADFFVDGLRDDVQYFRSFYNIERVEAHKGPNATIFGRGGGGGIINRITKGALVDQTLIAGEASIDTFGAWSVSNDLNVGIGPATLRLNAFYETLNNHRDAYEGDRYAVNPVIGVQIGEKIKLQLGYEYVKDSRVVDRGVPAAGILGTPAVGVLGNPTGPLRGFRDVFFGTEGVNQSEFKAHVVTFRTETELSDALKLSTQSLYGDYDKAYANVFSATAIGGTIAAPTLSFEAYRDPTKRKTTINQANLEWRANTGSIEHVILAGAEYTRQETANQRINGFFDGVALAQTSSDRRRVNGIALGNIITVPTATFRAGAGNRSVETDLKQVSAYVQDQISFGDNIDLIAGIRYDRLELGFTNVLTNTSFTRTDHLWSPRVGIVVKPVPQASVYASYTKSYLPQSGDQFLTLDASLATLAPEVFNNYEVGAKWDIKPNLSATVAVYRLDRANTRATVNNITVLTGSQRSSGLEIGLTGRIVPALQTTFGYAYTKAEISDTTTAAPTGRKIGQVPRHQISLWNRYDVSDRLGLGLGIYHQAKSFTTISNVTELPAYTRIDAAVFFKLVEGVEAQINVENLTDATYFPVAHNDANISTGAPINARFTLKARF